MNGNQELIVHYNVQNVKDTIGIKREVKMSEFKVGDKVKRVDSCGGSYNNMNLGDVATITLIDGSNLELKEYEGRHETSFFELIKRGKHTKLPKVTHIIIYDLTDRDSVIYCFSPKELRTELSKLYDNSDVIQSSIKVFEIKKVFETKNNVSLKEVK